MEFSYAIPIVGTLSLAAGILMPIRDGRRGRGATIHGRGPVRARFDLPPETRPSGAGEPSDPPGDAAAESHAGPRTHSGSDHSQCTRDEDDSAEERPDATHEDRTAVETDPTCAVSIRFAVAESWARHDSRAAVRIETESESATSEEDLTEPPAPPETAGDNTWSGEPVRRPMFERLRGLWNAVAGSSAGRAREVTSSPELERVDSRILDAVPNGESFAELLATLRGVSYDERNAHGDDDLRTGEAPPSPAVPHAIAVARPETGSRLRAVPLTRLPLRPLTESVTWPELLTPPETDLQPERRLARLREYADGLPAAGETRAFLRAWIEERGEARTLALRLLARDAGAGGRPAFIEALRTGTEDERAVAIDALAARELTADITVGLEDSSDAIVARASLATCASRSIADHRRQLERYLEPRRCEAVLALLAGILE